MSFEKFNEYYTVKELTGKNGFKKEQLLNAIHNGYLEAINVGFGGNKPRWLISEQAYKAFVDKVAKGEIKSGRLDYADAMRQRAYKLDKANQTMKVEDTVQEQPKAYVKNAVSEDALKVEKIKEKISKLQLELLELAEQIDDILEI